MQYIYAALLLHTAGKKIDEESLKKIITATGETPDEARIKTLITSLTEVNIDEAIKTSSAMTVPTVQKEEEPKEAKDEKKKEAKDEGTEDEAIAGLGALFG